jgi:hypothetical protein
MPYVQQPTGPFSKGKFVVGEGLEFSPKSPAEETKPPTTKITF